MDKTAEIIMEKDIDLTRTVAELVHENHGFRVKEQNQKGDD